MYFRYNINYYMLKPQRKCHFPLLEFKRLKLAQSVKLSYKPPIIDFEFEKKINANYTAQQVLLQYNLNN